jgi:hypothetical protein
MQIERKYYKVLAVRNHKGNIRKGEFYREITGAYIMFEYLEPFQGAICFYSREKSVRIEEAELSVPLYTSCVLDIREEGSSLTVKTNNSVYYMEYVSSEVIQTEEVDIAAMEEGDMYLEYQIRQDSLGKNGFFVHKATQIPVEIFVHAGMFMDTYLAMDTSPAYLFDVRFMLLFSHVQIYCWSESVKRIHFKNATPFEQRVKHGDTVVTIPPYRIASIAYMNSIDET